MLRIGQQRDRVLVDGVELAAVVAQRLAPVGIGAPRGGLGDEAAARLAGDAGVAFEVVAQATAAVGCLQQREGRELGQVDPVDEVQSCLEPAVGQERAVFELGQGGAIVDHRWLLGSRIAERPDRALSRGRDEWGRHPMLTR